MMGLFRKREVAETMPVRVVPDGQRVYAIGDIHGCLAALDELIERIGADDARRAPAQSQWIFLGDLVDRGPDSAGVVERLIALSSERGTVRFILGNHEEVLLRAFDGELEMLRLFGRIGGRETMLSYGVAARDYERADYPTLLSMMQNHIPQSHIDFLRSFETRIEVGDYVFVHAGLRPGVPVERQRAGDTRWIRNSFLETDWDFGKMVVHGHSISEGVVTRPNRIGIDTGAFETGQLTALGIEGAERWFLTTGPGASDSR